MPPKRTPSGGQSNSLLNFFSKTSDASGASPTSGGSGSRRGRAAPLASSSTGRNGKIGDRALGSESTCPVVISDDEEAVAVVEKATPAGSVKVEARDIKREKPTQQLEPKTSIPEPASEIKDQEAPLRRRTSSRPASPTSRPAFGPLPPPALPSPIASMPDFKPPGNWPSIINTASVEDSADLIPADDPTPAQLPRHHSTPTSPIAENLEALEDEWDEGDEEGMGMEDPEDEVATLGTASGVDTGSESVNRVEGVLGGRPRAAGKRKRRGVNADESDREIEGAEHAACPVCGKEFAADQGEQLELHVNTCLDASWSRDTLPPQAAPKGGSIKPAMGKPNKRPISAFCIPVDDAASQADEDEADADADDEDFAMLDEADEEAAREQGKKGKGPNAFSVLMSGHKEDAEWKVAEVDLKRDGKRVFGRRKAPFYKVMTGMPIAVDAFRYGAIPGIKAYLLTHAHSDHYTNLSSSWRNGPIYCSETTANLIKLMLGVDPKWVHGLPWDTPYELPDTGGVMVTVIKANHCPGSSLFLFEGRQTVNAGDSVGFKSPYVGGKRIWRYLHCGDFRACPAHVLHPAIHGKKIDTVYLDTTYLNPRYCFPAQPQVIEACANLARRTVLGIGSSTAPEVKLENGEEPDVKPFLEGQELADQLEQGKKLMESWLVKEEEGVKKEEDGAGGTVKKKGRTLVIMGTYSIGKERIVKGVARALNSKIYCDGRKRSILLCQADPELHSMLTTDPLEASIHLVPLQTIQLDRLQPYLHQLRDTFDRVLAFRPTGWTYTPPAGTDTLPDINLVIRRDQKRNFTDAYLRPMRGSSRQYMLFGVPYSEHSSFFELTCFALSVPGPDVKMIATVNVGSEKSRGKMKKWFERWQAEKVKRQKAGLPAIVEYRDETYW